MIELRQFFVILAGLTVGLSLWACTGAGGGTTMRTVRPINAPTAEGLYLAGAYAAATGDTRTASQYYSAALAKAGGQAQTLALQDNALISAMAAGDFDWAETMARRILAQHPNHPRARLVLAARAMRQERYRKALALITRDDLGPFNDFIGALMLAWALEGQGEHRSAVSALRVPADVSVVNGVVRLHEALILDRHNDANRAGTAYRSALRGGLMRRTAVAAYGHYLERHGRPGEAAAMYRAQLADEPGNLALIHGLVRVANGTPPGELALTPAQGAALGVFGGVAIHAYGGDTQLLAAYLQLVLWLDPTNIDARLFLATLMLRENLVHDAVEVLHPNRAIGRSERDRLARGAAPDWSAATYRTLATYTARLLAREDRIDEAVALLVPLIDDDPTHQTRTTLGDIYAQTGQWAQALDLYDAALGSGPGEHSEHGMMSANWMGYLARSHVFTHMGDTPSAMADLEHALALAPDQPSVMKAVGQAWMDQGIHLDQAYALMDRAVTLSPHRADLVAVFGRTQYQMGEYDQAVATLERAVLLDPADIEINDYLGDAYWQVGRRLESGFQWNHALGLDPDPDQRTALERKLEAGLDVTPEPESR